MDSKITLREQIERSYTREHCGIQNGNLTDINCPDICENYETATDRCKLADKYTNSILSFLDSPDSPYVLKSEVVKRIRKAELSPDEAREIGVNVLGIDCVRKIGEENPIMAYKIGQIQKADVLATIQKAVDEVKK